MEYALTAADRAKVKKLILNNHASTQNNADLDFFGAVHQQLAVEKTGYSLCAREGMERGL